MLSEPSWDIFSDQENLYIRINHLPVVLWYEDITTIVDLDQSGSLIGMEILLYEESKINFEKIQKQFQVSKCSNTEEKGLLYLAFPKPEQRERSSGFGRSSKLGFSKNGQISLIVIPWKTPGAGTPYVDSTLALKGFSYKTGKPPSISKYYS